MSIEEVHDRAEKRRLAAIDDILRKYQSLAPHLIMIEKARPQPSPLFRLTARCAGCV
jgi:hypothetical protein